MNMTDNKWWKNAIVYQIYPRSFQDGNNDGIGDIKGIIKRLDYLKDLGVNVLWLCPVYKSPMDDGGYDISDYYHIDPIFGTDEDMNQFIYEANKHGMKVLMDLVVNHTSDEHEWFRKALQNPESKYRNYYIFEEGNNEAPPNNWRSYFGGSAWEKVDNSNFYYLHIFGKKQPDLNWENKELREEIYKMVNYWLDKGLGGFRIDAISNLKKNLQFGIFPSDGDDGLCYIGDWVLNQPGIENFLMELKENTFKPHNSMTVAEANVPDELLKQFIKEDGFFSMVFDFSYADIDVPKTGEWFKPVNWTVDTLRNNIFHSQIETQKIGWGAVYLENHDQPRSLNKYLPQNEINYYSTSMMASLFMLLRGTPFIYQGQEIGMTNINMSSIDDYNDIATHDQYNRTLEAGFSEEEALYAVNKRSRDNSRTPMQWDNSKNAGFTDADKTWFKVNPNYKELNIKEQLKNPTSILQFYKKLIYLRTKSEYKDILVNGEFVPYYTNNSLVIAYKRVLGEDKLLIVHNFQNKEIAIDLDKIFNKVVMGNYQQINITNNNYILRPYECVILTAN